MIFHIPKEIASENKLWRSIFIKDFCIIISILIFTWITSASINSSYIVLYYVFMLSIAIILVQKNQKNNPNKRLYESIIILYKKSNRTYHSIDYNVITEEYKD